jgi:multidrug efflux pump subunit AcrA (membrane-fusion protein)
MHLNQIQTKSRSIMNAKIKSIGLTDFKFINKKIDVFSKKFELIRKKQYFNRRLTMPLTLATDTFISFEGVFRLIQARQNQVNASVPLAILIRCIGMSLVMGIGLPASAQTNPGNSSGSTSGIERREIRAQIKPVRLTLLSTELPGTLSLIKSEGSRVRRGDVLLSIDCSTFEAQLKKTDVEIKASEQQEAVQRRLFELNSTGQLDFEQAQFNTQRLKAEAGILHSQIRKCSLTAPHAGVITESRSRTGQYTQAGQPLLELVDDSAYEAEFLAPSAWVRRLKPGAALSLQVDELQAAQNAVIARVANKVDPVSQSVKVTVRITKPIAGLKSGMSGSVDTRSLLP